MTETYDMQVRSPDGAVLVGWLPVPLHVYQGKAQWFMARERYLAFQPTNSVRCFVLEVMKVQRGGYDDGWFALKTGDMTIEQLRQLAGFREASPKNVSEDA